MKKEKSSIDYIVRILDFRYSIDYNSLNFNYFYYTVKSKNAEEAVKQAKSRYMRGDRGESSEELPIMLKIFSAKTVSTTNRRKMAKPDVPQPF